VNDDEYMHTIMQLSVEERKLAVRKALADALEAEERLKTARVIYAATVKQVGDVLGR